MKNSAIVTAATAAGALGWGIARWLADAAVYAERVEEDEYCRQPAATVVPAAAVRT